MFFTHNGSPLILWVLRIFRNTYNKIRSYKQINSKRYHFNGVWVVTIFYKTSRIAIYSFLYIHI